MATGLSSSDEDDVPSSAAPAPVASASASGLGLSDSDDDGPTAAAAATTGNSNDGLGLSESSDDNVPTPTSRAVSGGDGLGLDSDDDDDDNVPTPTSRAVSGGDGLGLDSDDDDDDNVPTPTSRPAAGGGGDGLDDSDEEAADAGGASAAPQRQAFEATKAVRRDPQSHLYNIPALPRPPAGTTFVAKIPPQLGVEADEFTPRHTSTELDEKIRKLEAGDTEDAEAEIELAEIERDAAKQFVAHGSDFQNHMLWRFMRDSSGAIMTDAKGVAIRESNARLIKWSDGTMQLHVAKDVYEVTERPSTQGFIYAKQDNVSADGKKLPTVLECHGSVDARLSFRVAGVRGEALKKLQSKKQQKQNTKSSRVQVYATNANPLKMKAEREKKARARAKNWATASARSRPSQPRPSMRDASFLEYDEDNIRDIKQRGMYDDDSEEEEEYDDSDSGARGASKRRLDDDDDNDDDDDDDDDDGENMRKRIRSDGLSDDDSDV